MFRLMKDTLPGTQPLALQGSEGRETEIEGETADVHAFYAEDRFVTYLASKSDAPSEEIVDFNNLVSDTGDVSITRLGVEEGSNPTASASPPVVTQENPADLIDDGVLIADLAPHEILVMEMSDPTYTESVVNAVEASQGDNQDEIPSIPPEEGEETDEDNDMANLMAALGDTGGGGGGEMGLLLALGALPLLLLAA